MTLTERIHRIEPRRDELTERPRVVAFKPTWIKRMQDGQIKAKDMTIYHDGCGPDGAAA